MRTKQEIAERFDSVEVLGPKSKFFLLGIGGAGMSGVARLLLNEGFEVGGIDAQDSPVVEHLARLGAKTTIGHAAESLTRNHVLVISDAIDLGVSPEVSMAMKLGIPMLRRSQVLGWLLRGKKVIAVTGTHGKTTTSSMLALALVEAGVDPTCVIGAEVPQLGGAVIEGEGNWAVVEACEAYNSFLDLNPQIVVLTNLELDHVDFHGTYESLLNSVVDFVHRLPGDGVLIVCGSDKGCADVVSRCDVTTKTYQASTFEQLSGGKSLRLSGEHNRLNAGGALLAAMSAGIDLEKSATGIAKFAGADRRLQVLADKDFPRIKGRVTVVDDYAHHPTEIHASLQALREQFPKRRLVVVFQPHLYSRTQGQQDAFASALDLADEVVVTDIYPARERAIPGVSAFLITEQVTKPCRYIPSRYLLPRLIAPSLKPDDVVVGMGAGNISDFAPGLIEELNKEGVKKVAVIYGGDSAEREVSIHSSLAVEAALQDRYQVTRLDVSELLLAKGDLSALSGSNRPDVAILAVHGTHAEDGAIQGLLELAGIPYTGSGILSSALAMDKAVTKLKLTSEGLPVPNGHLVRKGRPTPAYPGPCVVKPNAQGSTVGLTFVGNESEYQHAVDKAFAFDDIVLIEEWVSGREVTVPVIGDKVYPVIEIKPQEGGYDFSNKYIPGKTNKVCPADFDVETTAKLQDYALRAHKALGCAGVTRTDMIVSADRIVILEVNTLPGMTGTSLVAMSAKAAGLEFPQLLDWMIQDAVHRYESI